MLSPCFHSQTGVILFQCINKDHVKAGKVKVLKLLKLFCLFSIISSICFQNISSNYYPQCCDAPQLLNQGFPQGTSGTEPACKCRRLRRYGFNPWVRQGMERGTATHSSILTWRIPMDRGAWWATVHRVAQSQTKLKRLSTRTFRIFHQIIITIITMIVMLLNYYELKGVSNNIFKFPC